MKLLANKKGDNTKNQNQIEKTKDNTKKKLKKKCIEKLCP